MNMMQLALSGLGIDPATIEKGLEQASQLGAVFAQLLGDVRALHQKMDAIGLHLGVNLPISPEALALASQKSAEALAQIEHDAALAVAHAAPTQGAGVATVAHVA